MLRVTDVLTRNLITAAIKYDKEITTTRQANYDILSGLNSCKKLWCDI